MPTTGGGDDSAGTLLKVVLGTSLTWTSEVISCGFRGATRASINATHLGTTPHAASTSGWGSKRKIPAKLSDAGRFSVVFNVDISQGTAATAFKELLLDADAGAVTLYLPVAGGTYGTVQTTNSARYGFTGFAVDVEIEIPEEGNLIRGTATFEIDGAVAKTAAT